MAQKIYIGTAGWNIPKQSRDLFGTEGSILEKYAQKFNCVEINSSFYRDHKPQTYQRWGETVGRNFRFSVKLSKYFTHKAKLEDTKLLKENLEAIMCLGQKLGTVLIQLPPKLEFDLKTAKKFFYTLRKIYSGNVVLEPRHLSWTAPLALDLMFELQVNKVMADPEPCPLPLRERTLVEDIQYYRLHGVPEIYRSKYSKEIIERIAKQLRNSPREIWCIFDNTTFGFATENALELLNEKGISPRVLSEFG